MTRMERWLSLAVVVLGLMVIWFTAQISGHADPTTDALVEVRRVGGDRVWKFEDGPFTCYVYRESISCGR